MDWLAYEVNRHYAKYHKYRSNRRADLSVEYNTEHASTFFLLRVVDFPSGETVWQKKVKNYSRLLADDVTAQVAVLLNSG